MSIMNVIYHPYGNEYYLLSLRIIVDAIRGSLLFYPIVPSNIHSSTSGLIMAKLDPASDVFQ